MDKASSNFNKIVINTLSKINNWLNLDVFKTEKQLNTLSHLAKLAAITNLQQIVEVVLEETPAIIDAEGCSIYLLPEFVDQFDGTLIDGDFKEVSVDNIDIMVLAANSRPDTGDLIGRAFYPIGYGLGGWVFKHGKALRIKDVSNEGELARISPDLEWFDRYLGSKYYYKADEKKPVLIVPLTTNSRTIGILKFPSSKTRSPFSETDERIATVVSQTIAGILSNTKYLQKQSVTIRHLVETSTLDELEEVFKAVTEHLSEILNCGKCQLFLRNDVGDSLELCFEDGQKVDKKHETYTCEDGITGWVFKTGRSINLNDIRKFASRTYLDDNLISEVSDSTEVDDGDRYIQYKGSLNIHDKGKRLPFIAAPVKDKDGAVRGVICANCVDENKKIRIVPFSNAEFSLVQTFANTVSLAFENDRIKKLGNLLTLMGLNWELKKLYKLVVEQIPELVSNSGCWIYRVEDDDIRLVQSSGNWNTGINDKDTGLAYCYGEGKTGFCALAESVLVVNHYGSGLASKKAIESELQIIKTRYENDLVDNLYDNNNRIVGLIQLRNGMQTSEKVRTGFRNLVNTLRIHPLRGLPSPNTNIFTQMGHRPSWSYVGVPIKHETVGFLGLITLGRPIDQNPFSRRDINLLEAVVGRFAAVIADHRFIEERKSMLVTMAHEINTPIQGIIADSENLVEESSSTTELNKLSKHNLENVQRLQFLTETILGGLSGEKPVRKFSTHSINKPLNDACELFRSEAESRGIIIEGPHSLETPFPDIEMSLFDLTIAFKNLVHNAVKYSFSNKSGKTNRFVKIIGYWEGDNNKEYTISIQNFGVGISQEEIIDRKIFDQFYRSEKSIDRRRTGAGIGLYYVKQIIEILHNGRIYVASNHVGGKAYLTTFYVTLPLKQPK